MLVERFFVPPSSVMRVRLGKGMQGGSGQPHGSPQLRAPESLLGKPPSLIMVNSPKVVLINWAFSGRIRGCLLGTQRAEGLYSRLERALTPHELFWAPPEPAPGHLQPVPARGALAGGCCWPSGPGLTLTPFCIWRTSRCPAGSQVAHFAPGTAEFPRLSLEPRECGRNEMSAPPRGSLRL